MPLALVFTSAPQGLAPGRSGFCTVARHAEMPERLAALLEGLGTPHAVPGSATYTLRRLEAGGKGWYVLSRFTAGGLDYTRRDNRLAHHLAFDEAEVAALPPPADVAARWPGWISEWQGGPRWLEPAKMQLAPGRALVPCAAWRRATGTGAKAAWLAGEFAAIDACLLNAQGTPALLELMAESGALLGRAAWDAAFTTDVTVTGAEGFAWCGGEAPGRRRIDLARADADPAPDGDRARLAAFGIAPRQAPAATRPPAAGSEAAHGPAPRWIIIGVVAAALLGIGTVTLLRSRRANEPTPPPPTTAQRAPTPEEKAAVANLLRANEALRELQDVVARGDLVTAARQWIEVSRISPEFTARHRDQFVPRIQAGIARAAADSIEARLAAPGVAEDTRSVEKLLAEVQDALRAADEIGAPHDAQWGRLRGLEQRATLLRQLDIRDTWITTGKWVTASAGPGVPSAADFELGRECGEAVGRFLREGLTGGPGTTTPVLIRLCEFGGLAQRDAASRPLRARLEPGASSLWVTEETAAGRRPSLTLSVGSRANVVSVNFPGPAPAGFTQSNHAVEIVNAAGKRLCIALVANADAIAPLQAGIDGLSSDSANQTVGLAAWIEPAFSRVRMSGGRIGLYPSGHEFPDRTASLASSRNRIDTELIRLAAGNGGVARNDVIERRRLLEAGDLAAAGGPWTIRFVDAAGKPVLTLAEFR